MHAGVKWDWPNSRMEKSPSARIGLSPNDFLFFEEVRLSGRSLAHPRQPQNGGGCEAAMPIWEAACMHIDDGGSRTLC